MQAELMGAQDQIGFQKAAPLQPFLVACAHPWLLFLPFFLYTLPLAHFPRASSLLRALINTLSTFSSSLKIPPIPFPCLSSFSVSVFLSPHISLLLPPSLSPSASCYLFVFPYSFCHPKLPAVTPSLLSTFSIHASFSSFCHLLFYPSIPHSFSHSVIYEQQGVCSPSGRVCCLGEGCLVAVGGFHQV